MCETKSSRWNVPRGIDRSEYYITVKDTISQAMSLQARNSGAVLGTVILASFTNSYVEGSAGFTSVSGQTVRNHLKKQDPLELVRMNDDVVMKLRSSGALSGKCILAIDTHDIMYYGDPGAEGVVGTQPKKGSHWAYKFGSIGVLLGGERLTLAAVPVMHGEPRVEHVKKLIEYTLFLGIRPKIVLLDAAYNSAEVINYLKGTGLKYIIRIAAPIDGIRPGDDFIYRTRGHRRREEEQATFRLVAVNGRDKRSGKVGLFVFATNTSLKARRIRRLFRKRWGIETSYRMINKFLARTTSKLHTLRMLYFYLAILLYNLWVMLNYHEPSRIIADSLKVYVVLAAVLSFIADIEGGTLGLANF